MSHVERVRQEDVVKGASISSPLVILDDQVLDLSGFLDHHPGGPAVLLANLGRDVSADFHHVTAHARRGVLRKVSRQVVADVDYAAGSPARKKCTGLLDHMRLVLNSFDAQSDPERDPLHELVFVGQLYSHLAGDHLPSFLRTLSGLAGKKADAKALWQLGRIYEVTPNRVEEMLDAADGPATAALAKRIRESCAGLLTGLLVLGADALGALRVTGAENSFSILLEKAVNLIKEWARDEYDLVVSE